MSYEHEINYNTRVIPLSNMQLFAIIFEQKEHG